ncbi:peptidoglycan-associated lipoprotein Pal [Porticoccaceae bacterium]|nr:peptidoglycan-associated lipoprotein Pal [Porticoccaceae bacterium]MDA8651295.1 peptidoglycan-associated lipoprotein Pal [Porticoccaceae bacterium]MDA8664337.1 peptidoglycan-associated lipoprotein Pal [Porticoccaceae bacterium]MDA8682541.1 peptidoglycan-associated lipoprotein Pal [Porticoccaceae bacterium]MDA8788896.1 peptidoglycan-associated lipoprotein Pal [Porticoccaceae bacterium]
MKFLSNHAGFAAILMASLLAACSSAPVDESSSTIEDTSVQTAELEMQRQAEAEAVAAAAAVEEEPVNNADTVFYFEFDKAVLSDDSRAALIAHAQFMKQYPSTIRLEGHADERGTREYNMALGERRAIAVKEFLVMQGVSESAIEVVSYGEERAASFGSNAAAWRMNRRVELK